MSSSSSERNKRRRVFAVSALLGALVFILIYGPYVLNPFYDGWIFNTGERDLIQHYVGFCAYRSSPWQFPIGLVTTASYPNDMSVIYTDAIPLFAFAVKMVSPLLPRVFQYLGIYGMLSMSLMGGFGALILYELTGKAGISIISSLFYALSWTVLYRMFYHTSLTSQWLILIAIYIWIRVDYKEKPIRMILMLFFLSCIAMLIHPYIWAMCGGIVIMSLVEHMVIDRKYYRALMYGMIYCITGGAVLYAFGALSGGVGAKLDVGKYEANLNTLYNSCGLAILPGFPTALLQYEGFGYLGAGVLFLGICALLIMIIRRKLPRITFHRVMMSAAAACFIIFSIVPEISLNDKILIDLKLGKVEDYIVGIFRSNGRFIWPVCFLLLTAVLVYVIRCLDGKRLLLLIIFSLILQITDMIPFLTTRHELFSRADYKYTGWLEEKKEIKDVIDKYDHIVMDIDDGEIDQDLTYFAYLHGMTTNDFYYARPIGHKVQGTLEALREDMKKGKYDDSLLYVLSSDSLPLYRDLELHFYEVDGRYIASHQPIPGLDGYRK